MPFFNQFGRFAAIGFTNFIVYTGILNIFLWWTSISSGIWYSVFVSVAFVISVMHSYGFNKYWVFESGNSGQGKGELTRFFIITGIAGLINVGVASFLVNVVGPLFGITPDGWANIGGIVGSAVALIFSFAGTRLFVFRSNKQIS
jgi:putative flippase GtrA